MSKLFWYPFFLLIVVPWVFFSRLLPEIKTAFWLAGNDVGIEWDDLQMYLRRKK